MSFDNNSDFIFWIDEEKSLIAKFGEGATKSGATLKGIFEKAIGKKVKKEK